MMIASICLHIQLEQVVLLPVEGLSSQLGVSLTQDTEQFTHTWIFQN